MVRKCREHWNVINHVVTVIKPSVQKIEHNAIMSDGILGSGLRSLLDKVVVVKIALIQDAAEMKSVNVSDALPREAAICIVVHAGRMDSIRRSVGIICDVGDKHRVRDVIRSWKVDSIEGRQWKLVDISDNPPRIAMRQAKSTRMDSFVRDEIEMERGGGDRERQERQDEQSKHHAGMKQDPMTSDITRTCQVVMEMLRIQLG